MPDVLDESYPVARKHYRCMACAEILEDVSRLKGRLTFSELRAVALAKQHKGRILPGERYYCQANVDSGDIYRWRAIPAIHKICERLEIYDYD